MRVEELREMLKPYKKDQELVFVVGQKSGENIYVNCKTLSELGSPVFRDDVRWCRTFKNHDDLVNLPFNAVIIDLWE